MQRLAKPILLFAVLGVVSMFLPGPRGSLAWAYGQFDLARVILTVAGCALAGLGAAFATRDPKPWQSYFAVGGFTLAFVKMKTWSMLQAFSSTMWPAKLCAIALTGGLIFSLLAVVNDARARAARAA